MLICLDRPSIRANVGTPHGMRTNFKNSDVTESRYGQNISSRSSSRRLEQVDEQGMRDGVHTIRNSCYHRETGAGMK